MFDLSINRSGSFYFYFADVETYGRVEPGESLLPADGPRFIQEPPPLLEFTNQTGAAVWCAATGHPPPSVMWVAASELGASAASTSGAAVPETAGLRRIANSPAGPHNISLVFPPFPASAYRPDVHSTAYRCRASSSSGTILSREMRLRAGNKKKITVRLTTTKRRTKNNLFLIIVSVLVQSYETQATGGSAVKGGVAVLRCAIPPAIKNDIQVTAWIQEFTGLTIFPSLQGGKFEFDSFQFFLSWAND